MSDPLKTQDGGTGIAAPERGALLVGDRTSPMGQVLPGEVGAVLRVVDKETLGYEVLAAADVGAAATSHSHAQSDITSLVSDLAGKAAASHSHAVADITPSTSTAIGVGSVELGHASDTTFARVSAGVAAVEGNKLLTENIDFFRCLKSSDQTAIGTSYADLTSLTLGTLANGVYYRFEFWLIMDSDGTGTGIDVSVNSATASNVLEYTVTYWTTANAVTVRGQNAFDADTASTGSNGTSRRIFKIEGIVSLNGAGSIIARAKREAVGSGPACRAGSFGIAWKLG